MIRHNNYTTLLLVLIVLILLVGVGIAIYYVFDLDWFARETTLGIYKEMEIYSEQSNNQGTIEKA